MVALLQRRLVDLAVAELLDARVEAGRVEHLGVDVGQRGVLGEVGVADHDLAGPAGEAVGETLVLDELLGDVGRGLAVDVGLLVQRDQLSVSSAAETRRAPRASRRRTPRR